jgi:putative membrane protein
MSLIAQIAVGFVALLHLGFLVLEMAYWDKPQGMRAFGTTPEFAKASRAMAANQGLYNGFLALGLLWSLVPIGAAGAERPLASFFLGCVIVAGIFGALTANRRIIVIQALPALVALACVWVLPA